MIDDTIQENRKLIGWGNQGVDEANEPQLSENIGTLIQTSADLLRGDERKPPAALSGLARLARFFSIFVQLTAWIFRKPTMPAREARPRVVALIVGALLVGVIGWLFGAQVNVVSLAVKFAYVVAAALVLVATGTVLGTRAWAIISSAMVAAFTAGLAVGVFVLAAFSHVVLAITCAAIGAICILVAGVGVSRSSAQRSLPASSSSAPSSRGL